jgi:hypothetical protein
LELDINAFCSTLNAKQDSSAVQINGTSRNWYTLRQMHWLPSEGAQGTRTET